ncbi:MAG: hypothetical protein KDN22_28440, partial [Verrucomicrobiae bacterium]|nr:hypothetical protein [Verrucomicrobiae bacterium]
YWLSRDPIGERGGLNLYGFVGNDGVNQYDVLGQFPGIPDWGPFDFRRLSPIAGYNAAVRDLYEFAFGCAPCCCKVALEEVTAQIQTLKKLEDLWNEAITDINGDGKVNLDFEATANLGGGVSGSSSIKPSDDCSKKQITKCLKRLRGSFEGGNLRGLPSAAREYRMRFLGKIRDVE